MKIFIAIMFLMGAFVPNVYSQDTLLLDFSEAIRIGLSQNLMFQTKINEQEILKKERQAALLGHLPRVNMSNSFYRQMGQQYQQVEGQLIVTNVTNDIASSNINATLPLVNAGRRLNTTRATRLYEDAGEHGLHRAAQEVVFNIAQQYLQVLLDRELYLIALENLENQKQQLRQIEGFVEAGIRTLSDQYNQQSEVARLLTVVLDAEIKMETDLWLFAETLQLESGSYPMLEPVNMDAQRSEFMELSLPELYEISLNNRRDLLEQKSMEQGHKRMLSVSRSFYYPQLSAYFNYSTFATTLDERSFADQFLRIYPQSTIGLSLTIPIFNNFENKVLVTRSKVAYQNQQLEYKAQERMLTQETKLAYDNYRAAIRREEATKVQLSAAEEAQKVIAERFRLGVSNFVDLAQANQQLVEAQSDYTQAVYTNYFQEVILRYTLGILEVESL
ncbi:TolC family protein [Anditalea andensis]|uniref:Transporter n=1 Tax=Anditalea andensis TaxID=1048983 RepID=A0A074LEU1_9BACT|nr:TolC family protein [Anditalea andensis]KEO72312.1 transporter [Anditalea andensis]